MFREVYNRYVPAKAKDSLRFLKHPYYSLLRRILKKQSGLKIMQGPFRGMKFNVPDFNSAMLLGSWEKELWPCIESINEINPTGFICIGAAEGYYAVGLALKYDHVPMLAFEEQEKYKVFLRDLAKENEVENITIKGRCGPTDVESSVRTSGLSPIIICDVEGAEIELLDPGHSQSLKHAYILVEIHEMYVDNCEKTLIDRFSATHEATIIPGKHRTVDDLPEGFSSINLIAGPKTRVNLMNEGRPHLMNWVWFSPQSSAKS